MVAFSKSHAVLPILLIVIGSLSAALSAPSGRVPCAKCSGGVCIAGSTTLDCIDVDDDGICDGNAAHTGAPC